MKTTSLWVSLLTLILCSCHSKRYQYIETAQQTDLLAHNESKELEPKIIQANSDSAAYIKAYEYWCISKKVSHDMQKSSMGASKIPVSFKLLNEEGKDIQYTVSFASKEQQEKEMEASINSLKTSVPTSNASSNSSPKQGVVDSGTIKELLKSFRVKKDEFSNTNEQWYQPKTAPIYTNSNGFYAYFQTENGTPGPLRLRFQYYADEWLFFKKIQFAIDGKAYEFIPIKTETDNGDGGHIWEWFDESISDTDRDLVNALSNAKSAKMKIIGRQYYNEKPVTATQIKSFKQSLDLYHAMGGSF